MLLYPTLCINIITLSRVEYWRYWATVAWYQILWPEAAPRQDTWTIKSDTYRRALCLSVKDEYGLRFDHPHLLILCRRRFQLSCESIVEYLVLLLCLLWPTRPNLYEKELPYWTRCRNWTFMYWMEWILFSKLYLKGCFISFELRFYLGLYNDCLLSLF